MVLRWLTALTLTNLICFNVFANDYEDAWKALARNDRATAKALLLKAMNDPKTAEDAYVTYLYFESFNGKDSDITDFQSRLYNKLKDPSPYIYALWFNGAALGSYGKKSGHQLQLLDRLLSDNSVNGSIRASAHYFKSMHYLKGNDMQDAQKEHSLIGSLSPAWQVVGPFDNISGSGYDKDYGPLKHPEADAVFTSFNNTMVKWFTPASMSNDGYVFMLPHFRRKTAVVYAQTFVLSPDDRELLLNVGAGGSIKVWINDAPVMASSKERITELDYYKQSVKLKKGYNRVLIQLGYTDNDMPNFIVRFTDNNYNTVGGLSNVAAYQSYPASHETSVAPVIIRHFAEAYFEQKVAADPENLVNYVLLTETYLRDQKLIEARQTINAALKRAPENSLLRCEYMQVLIKEKNRTKLLEEIEWIKTKDPDCLIAIRFKIDQLIDEKKYDEAYAENDHCISLYGADQDTWETKMKLYSQQDKMDELIKTIQAAYEKYPNDPTIVRWMWSMKVNGYKDAKAGITVLETFLKQNYDYNTSKLLEEEYVKQGQKDKALAILKAAATNFPYDPELLTDLSSFYYAQADYEKSSDYGRQALKLAPYVATYWENLGLELQPLHHDTSSNHAYRQALYYNPNSYSAREHLRDLENKPSLWKAFPETDVYQAIKDAAGKTFDHDYFYIQDDKYAIVYPEGATEEYTSICIKILTQKGLDKWKETSIGYNSGSQDLKVEKAEVVKKSGSVQPADQNDNQIVFTGLEVGDAIVLRYKIQHFAEGRISRHFWDTYNFNASVPELKTRYCLLIANNVKFDYKVENGTVEPVKKAYDDYTLYTWEMNNPTICESEPFMPSLTDVGPTLHLSTITSWSDIANWYGDLCSSQTDDDFEVKQVYDSLFPKTAASLTDKEKAMRIYQYIMDNVHYSSVSFRQGAYIPQKASVTIDTRLGDCKDVSSLFVTLARLSGLKAQMVLVNTRDNGTKEMILPSMAFNHCVVKTWLDGKAYFLELTDNQLPFAALPGTDEHAQCLVIPESGKIIENSHLEFLESPYRVREKISRKILVQMKGNDLNLTTSVCKTGTLASGVRGEYAELSPSKQQEQFQSNFGSGFKNAVKVDNLSFFGLTDNTDSAGYKFTARIQNEVIDVSDMHMIKIPFSDVIASVDNFSKDDRQFPVEYWNYENTDEYETILTVEAPADTKFIEVPKNEKFTFRGSTYTLDYIPVNAHQIKIVRKAILQRDNVKPEEYKAMKDFFNKIVKAESKYLAYK